MKSYDKWEIAEKLMEIDNGIWERHGFYSRPEGRDRETYLTEAVAALKGFGLEKITDEVREILANENFHTLNEAVGLALETAVPSLTGFRAALGHCENVAVVQNGERGCIWASGDTKPHREELKALGFRWSPKQAAWYFKPAA